jgi:hypothetical protein
MYPIMKPCVHQDKMNQDPVVRLDCGEGQTEGPCAPDTLANKRSFCISGHVGTPWQVVQGRG